MDVQFTGSLRLGLADESVTAPWLTGRGTKWLLVEDFTVIINGQRFTVPRGYVTDMASIPSPLWWCFPPSYRPAMEAAVFHDCCYSHWYKDHMAQGHWRYGVSKRFADNAFRALMRYNGASAFTAGLFHWAVSTFGRGGWENG